MNWTRWFNRMNWARWFNRMNWDLWFNRMNQSGLPSHGTSVTLRSLPAPRALSPCTVPRTPERGRKG